MFLRYCSQSARPHDAATPLARALSCPRVLRRVRRNIGGDGSRDRSLQAAAFSFAPLFRVQCDASLLFIIQFALDAFTSVSLCVCTILQLDI